VPVEQLHPQHRARVAAGIAIADGSRHIVRGHSGGSNGGSISRDRKTERKHREDDVRHQDPPSDYVKSFTNNQDVAVIQPFCRIVADPAGKSHTLEGMVLIFGKDGCPYTQAARDHYAAESIPFEYINVRKSPSSLDRMLEYSDGLRKVPVIVEEDKVTIGFGGS
jgi:glutaredoxin